VPIGRKKPTPGVGFRLNRLAVFLPPSGVGARLTMTPPRFDPPKPTVRHGEIVRVFEERRRWIRIDVAARLITTEPSTPQPDIALLDVNPAGFHIATVDPVPVNAVFLSQVTLGDGTHVQPRARVAYCRPQPADGHDGGYLSRFDFED